MFEFYYIVFAVLLTLAVASLSHYEHKVAATVITLSCLLNLSMFSMLSDLAGSGSLAGFFSLAVLSMILSFIMVTLYKIKKQTILLKLATTSAVFTCVHMLYIMTYIEPIRAASWYYAPLFDKAYWYYGELQIVLTLYMISLFWKSGIRGLYVGFDKARSYFNNVHPVRSGINTSIRINNSVLVGSNKSNKKGVQQ